MNNVVKANYKRSKPSYSKHEEQYESNFFFWPKQYTPNYKISHLTPKTSLSNFSVFKFKPAKEKQTIVKLERDIHDADIVSQLAFGHVFLVNLKEVLCQTFLSSFLFGF